MAKKEKTPAPRRPRGRPKKSESNPYVIPGIKGEPDVVVDAPPPGKRKPGRPPKDFPKKLPPVKVLPTPVVPEKTPYIAPEPGSEEEKRSRFRWLPVIRAEKWWVDNARNDPAYFYEYMTGYSVSRHHRMWLANIFHPTRKRLNFIAPRESNKSSSVVYALAWLIGSAPLLTSGLISVSAAIAEARLRMIRGIVSDNTRFSNVFPTVYIDKQIPDTQQEFTVASSMNDMPRNVWRSIVERNGSLKDATLFVSGAGGRGVIGRRFSGLLILDDIIDENYLKDELQEAMMEYIIRTLIPCVKEEGKVVNIGTRWMIGDIPERLMNNPAWHTIQIEAIRHFDDGTRRSYWPEYWPLEKLDNKKAEMNNDAMFNIMYMNDPTAMTSALFTPAQLDKDIPAPLPKLKGVYVGTDWSVSEKTRSDWTVFSAMGVDFDDNWYLLDMTRFKDTNNAVELLGQFCDRVAATYSMLTAVVIEKVGFQAFLQTYTGKFRPDLPTVMHVPKGDKHHRGKYVQGLAQNNKFFINQKIPPIQTLKTEWLNFPLARHDDTLDAVSIVTQYVGGGISVKGTRVIRSPYLL